MTLTKGLLASITISSGASSVVEKCSLQHYTVLRGDILADGLDADERLLECVQAGHNQSSGGDAR